MEIEIAPDEAADRTLVEHVHPPAWRNPEAAPTYDLVVLGGGTAGWSASFDAPPDSA